MPSYGSNLLPNPGAETNTTGWSGLNSTLTRITTPVRTGAGAFQLAASAAGNVNLVAADITTGATPGLTVQVVGWVRSAAVARTAALQVDWYGAAGYVSTTGAGTVTTTTSGWSQMTGVVTVPTGANRGSFYGQVQSAGVSEVHYFDDMSYAAEVATAPTANAGPDQSVVTGSTVTLTGSGSGGSGTISTYTWTLPTRPAGSAAALSGTGATRTFTADVAGTYVASLTVTDSASATSAADTVTITAAASSVVTADCTYRLGGVLVAGKTRYRLGGVLLP